jgi:paraquat-inducible protein B
VVDAGDLPEPVVARHRRGWPSAIWIVPIIAIAAGVALGVRTYLRKGPTLRITFESAEGLEAGKSEVRYKNVTVGRVRDVTLSDDRLHIVAIVELNRGAKPLAAKDSRFWVERPRVGLGGVSGLGTLISGAYIGVDPGPSDERADRFVGLEKPPGVTRDQRGRKFRLTAPDAGSLAVRSPVYLHRVNVGFVSELELAKDGKRVEIEVFVPSPYDATVTDQTVWWNASGLDVAIDANGLRVDAQSLATVVAGGLAFDVRDPEAPGNRAPEGMTFPLYDNRATALTPPDGVRVATELRFHEPVRGIAAGAALDLDGVRLGSVDQVRPGYDALAHELYFDVTASVFPQRLGAAYAVLSSEPASVGKTPAQILQVLVGRGLRAQIRSGNLLTGQAYIALAWFPRAKPAVVRDDPGAWIIPTERGGTEQLQQQVADIVAKVDRIPFEAIGENVRGAAAAASGLFGHLDRDVVPDAKQTLAQAQLAMSALREGLTALRDNVAAPDSAIQQSARTALEQLDRAAFSLRGLTDYIQAHPEALLRGRKNGPEPTGPP